MDKALTKKGVDRLIYNEHLELSAGDIFNRLRESHALLESALAASQAELKKCQDAAEAEIATLHKSEGEARRQLRDAYGEIKRREEREKRLRGKLEDIALTLKHSGRPISAKNVEKFLASLSTPPVKQGEPKPCVHEPAGATPFPDDTECREGHNLRKDCGPTCPDYSEPTPEGGG